MNTIKNKYIVYTLNISLLLMFLYSVVIGVAPNISALECTDGATSSGGVCGTDTAGVHVSVEGGWAISVSSSGMLDLDLTPTSSGIFSTITDNLNVYTNIPTGYQLYLNSTSGSTDIYNNDLLDDNGNLSVNLPVGTNTNHFTATTGTKDAPVALINNTWGYSLDNSPTTFSKVPLTSEDADSNIYSNPAKTSSSGDNIPVTYGFKADTSLTPGTYSTSVTYTAIADAPTYTITSVSPNMLLLNDQTDKTITIMTSTPTSELAFGNISAKIGDIDLTNCTEITNDGYRGVECTYNGNLDYGTYNVELTSSWHNATYILTDGFNIGGKTIDDITYMQEMTVDMCDRIPDERIDQTFTLKDARDEKSYKIVKHKDNNCWMQQNLALDGGITLTPSDSNVTQNRTLNPNISSGTMTDKRDYIFSGIANSYTSKCDTTKYPYCIASAEKYGNLYNWIAATAGVGATSTTQTVKESVCPSAADDTTWRLPDNGDSVDLKSYANLAKAYGLSTTNVTDGTQTQTIQKSPLSFPLAGLYSSSAQNQAYSANYYSRDVVSGSPGVAYRLNFYTSRGVFAPQQNNANKTYGYSLRCVLGE